MKSCFKAIGSTLFFFLLGLSTSQESYGADQCAWRTTLSAKLNSGALPQDSDIPHDNDDQPQAAKCEANTPYDRGLAITTAEFIGSNLQKKPTAVAEVLRIIKKAYHAQKWPNEYLQFAKDLKSNTEMLPGLPLTVADDASQATSYAALDAFIKNLETRKKDPCLANLLLVTMLQNDSVPSGFISDETCNQNYYLKLAEALLPLVSRDLHDKTSRTATLIRKIQESLSERSQNEAMSNFSKELRDGLSGSDIGLWDKNMPSSDFLNRLSYRIEHPSYPPIPRILAFGLAGLWILTLTNTTLLAYLLRQHFKPAPSPVSSQDPQVVSMANRLDNLSALHAKTVETLDSLEKRLPDLEAPPRAGAVELKERLESIELEYQQIQKQLVQWNSKLSGLEDRPPGPPTPPGTDQSKLSRDVDALKGQFRALYKMIVRPSEGSPEPGVNSIGLEREILSESWKKFRDNKELIASIERSSRDKRWQEIRDPLLFQLPQAVPDDLKATFDAVLAPARDYHNLITKISLVPRLVNGDLPKLESEAQEVTRIREFTHLLAMTLNSNLVADRLNFRLERWITDQFLSFADLFLQRFQQAQMEGKAASLEPGLGIVRQVLGVANLAPIELVLGQTVFDSTKHIGRSTTSDTSFPDGVVMAAVRNGFVQGGQQVLRQPEVIVNRVR